MKKICIENFLQKVDAKKYVHKTNKKINDFFVELVEVCEEKNIEVYCKINNVVYSINEMNQLHLIPFAKFEEETKYKGILGILISIFLPEQFLYTYRIIYFAEPKYEFLFYNKKYQFAQGWAITDYELLFGQNKDIINWLKSLEIFKENLFKEKESDFKISLPDAKFYREDEVM